MDFKKYRGKNNNYYNNNNRGPPPTYMEQFIRKVGPKVVSILLLVVAKALTDPLVHASKNTWQSFRKSVIEPNLNGVYETLGIPRDPQLRIGLDQYVFEHLPAPAEQKSLFRVEKYRNIDDE